MTKYFDPSPGKQDTGRAFGWALWGALFVIVVGLLVFALRWILVPTQVLDPNRIQRLSQQANEHWQSLQAQRSSIAAQAAQLSDFERLYGADASVWPQGKQQEYLQLAVTVRNLKTAYNASCGQYNALWQDEWRDLPAPDDLPRRCEFLD